MRDIAGIIVEMEGSCSITRLRFNDTRFFVSSFRKILEHEKDRGVICESKGRPKGILVGCALMATGMIFRFPLFFSFRSFGEPALN